MNEFGWDRWLLASGFAALVLWPLVRELLVWRSERREQRTAEQTASRDGREESGPLPLRRRTAH